MQANIEKLPKAEVKITFSIEPSEIVSDLENAAKRISEATRFDGFHPGKVPFDVVKSKVGEMAIWNEAAEEIVRHAYAKVVIDNKLNPIGSPEIDLVKLAPGNPIEFTATVIVLPAVTKLPELTEIKVKAKIAKVEDKDIEAALAELQRMQTREVEVERPATAKDKVTMNLKIERDHVAIEGGETKNHAVYLSEPYYIPGFVDQIVGMKTGDSKTFTLTFPENNFQKNLAGSPADFTAEIIKVEELVPPPLDDDFAKTLGQDSFDGLKTILHENMLHEAEEKEIQRQEAEALEEVVKLSEFEELPSKIVDVEAEKMVHELEHSVAERGLLFKDYLANVKKTANELKLDFVPQAMKRVKTILAIRALADRENITVSEDEIALKVAGTMNQYKDDPEAQKQIRSEEYADQVRTVLRNRKTIERLREKTVEKDA